MFKKSILVLFAVMIAGFAYSIITSEEVADLSEETVENIETQQVFDDAIVQVEAGGAVLLDVRTPEEYSELHAVGSTLFELSRLEDDQLPRYPADQKIYVYCRSGNRSAQAVDILRKAGFIDVIDLGALSDWQAAGGEVQSG